MSIFDAPAKQRTTRAAYGNKDEVKPEFIDLKNIFELITSRKPKCVLEFGVGFSTICIALALKENEKKRNNQIIGCSSQSWVITTLDSKENLYIRTDSEALIVKGLLSILEFILNGNNKEIIYKIEAQDILENINLNRSITSQRTNGFISAINKIRSQIKYGN